MTKNKDHHGGTPHGDAPGESPTPPADTGGSPTSTSFRSPIETHPSRGGWTTPAYRSRLSDQELADLVAVDVALPGHLWKLCEAKRVKTVDGVPDDCSCGLLWLTENFGLALVDDDQQSYPKISRALVQIRNSLPALLAEVTEARARALDVEAAELRGFHRALTAMREWLATRANEEGRRPL